jgi:hypothetical protein
MALVKCRECGKEISTKAASCPNCGVKSPAPGRTAKRLLLYLLGIPVAVGLIAGIFGQRGLDQPEAATKAETDRRAAQTPEQRAAEDKAAADRAARAAKSEAAWRSAQALAASIRKGANDPSSIQIEEAVYTDAGAVAIEFRGKNTFGALIKNRAVMTPDGKIAAGSDEKIATVWNRHIAGKTTYHLPKP